MSLFAATRRVSPPGIPIPDDPRTYHIREQNAAKTLQELQDAALVQDLSIDIYRIKFKHQNPTKRERSIVEHEALMALQNQGDSYKVTFGGISDDIIENFEEFISTFDSLGQLHLYNMLERGEKSFPKIEFYNDEEKNRFMDKYKLENGRIVLRAPPSFKKKK